MSSVVTFETEEKRFPIRMVIDGIPRRLTKNGAIDLKNNLQRAIDELFVHEYGTIEKHKSTKKMSCPECKKNKMWLDKGLGWKCLGCYAGPFMVTDTNGGFVKIKSDKDGKNAS